MAETSNEKLQKICLELRELTLRKEHLNDRLRLLIMLKEMQNPDTHEGQKPKNDEYDQMFKELLELMERKNKLQELQEALERKSADDHFIAVPINGHDGYSAGNQIFVVERPPSFPAPQVIFDVEKLPPNPSPTRCPHCEAYITTEVRTVVGNTAWLMCLVSTCLCCIVGCCLIPFCTNRFKDVVHKCPNCRSHLHTCTKL